MGKGCWRAGKCMHGEPTLLISIILFALSAKAVHIEGHTTASVSILGSVCSNPCMDIKAVHVLCYVVCRVAFIVFCALNLVIFQVIIILVIVTIACMLFFNDFLLH